MDNDSVPSCPRRRLRRALAAAAVVVAAVAAMPVLHFANLPDFYAWAAAAPAGAPPAPPAAFRVLSTDGAWSTGLGPIPGSKPDAARFATTVRHGNELLLDWRQSIELASSTPMGDRTGLTTRTDRLATYEGFQAAVRTTFDDPDAMIGPGSTGRGRALFEVWLSPGRAPNTSTTLAAGAGAALGPEPGATPVVLVHGILGSFDPFPRPPAEGPKYYVAMRVDFNGHSDDASSSTHAIGVPTIRPNTGLYSFEIECECAMDEGGKTHQRLSLERKWGGKIR